MKRHAQIHVLGIDVENLCRVVLHVHILRFLVAILALVNHMQLAHQLAFNSDLK